MAEQRYDISRLAGGKVERLSTGGVRVPANLTRIGVFDYRNSDGTVRRELRLPEEVFDADSLASLQDAPVLEGHPAMVSPENYQTYTRGNVSGTPRADGDFVAGKLAIQAGDTVAKIDRADLAEISCGYTCDFEPSPGNWRGQKYDGIQRNIRYNHVGLGPTNWGRAGREVALRLDGGVCDFTTIPVEKENKVKVRFDGKEYERGSDDHILALESKLDGLLVESKTAGETERKRADQLDAQLTAEKAEHAKTKARLDEATDQKRFDAAVTARVDLLVKARGALGDQVNLDGKSDLEVMSEVVKLAYPTAKLDGKSADYVSALFDQAITSGVRSDSITRLPEVLDRAQTRLRADAAPAQPAYKTHKWAISKE